MTETVKLDDVDLEININVVEITGRKLNKSEAILCRIVQMQK